MSLPTYLLLVTYYLSTADKYVSGFEKSDLMVFQEQQVLNSQYQLQKRLGRTAAGHQTWLAIDQRNQKSVVIKLLAFNPQMRWEELKLFEREAQILKALDHPCIPQYYDYFDLNKEIGQGVPWFALVQQYIPGLSLQELLEQSQRFTEEKIRTIAEETLDILIYLHQLNPSVLHRDIKPSNLILGEDDRIYLIDFGAVQAQAAVTGVTFTVVGTVGYAPLEQFWGRAVEASDLYALGGTLIHLLTGKSPADLPQKDSKIQFRDRVNLQPNFTDWLEKITELSTEKRFQNAALAKEALNSKIFTYRQKNKFNNIAKNPLIKQRLKIVAPVTLIELKKELGQLEIKIPAGGLNRLDELLNSGCSGLASLIVWFCFSLGFTVFFPALLLIFPTMILIKLFLLLASKTDVLLDRRKTVIYSNVLGLKYDKKTLASERINNVFIQRTGSIFQVALGGRDRIYNLGGALKQEEAAWLAAEIREHLDL